MGDERRARAHRIAAFDLGTVSSRLLLAEVEDGRVVRSSKRTVITELGEGVDASGLFAEAAVRRVLDACEGFLREVAGFGPERVCTTLTSAARDVSNGERLLRELEALGLAPQVIPGEVEARLTFYGVARDFPGERIAVADSGGGSTEIAVGSCVPGEPLSLECAQSLNIGCRRVFDKFLASDPATDGEFAAARAWVRPQFDAYWAALESRPERLVAVGGTVTTLSALAQGMEVYDSHRVHLSELSLGDIEAGFERMRGLTRVQVGELPAVQPERARVLPAGTLVIRELVAAGGYTAITVSENSIMAGVVQTVAELLDGREPAIGWTPRLSY